MKAEEVIRKAPTFMEVLMRVNDARDNRGKRHELAFVLACVIVAILSGKSYMSSIHRFRQHKITWLKEIFERPEAKAVSRAQLPNIVAVVAWEDLNAGLEEFFPFQLVNEAGEWTACDGKSLKGTIADPMQAQKHERIVTAVMHTSHEVLCQRRFSGDKEREVTVVRELLDSTGLVGGNVSLDAGHANPTTLGAIHQAGGEYVVQIKENQPQLLENRVQLADQAEQAEQVGASDAGEVSVTVDNGHGRLEERVGRGLSLPPGILAKRWKPTGMSTLIVMDRMTEELKTGSTSAERSYYVSNQSLPGHERELFDAIRGHWRIESMHYIRDVTFNEDRIRTKDPNEGQILSLLRTIALTFLHHEHPTNVRAMLEKFADLPDSLHDLLISSNVLSVA